MTDDPSSSSLLFSKPPPAPPSPPHPSSQEVELVLPRRPSSTLSFDLSANDLASLRRASWQPDPTLSPSATREEPYEYTDLFPLSPDEMSFGTPSAGGLGSSTGKGIELELDFFPGSPPRPNLAEDTRSTHPQKPAYGNHHDEEEEDSGHAWLGELMLGRGGGEGTGRDGRGELGVGPLSRSSFASGSTPPSTAHSPHASPARKSSLRGVQWGGNSLSPRTEAGLSRSASPSNRDHEDVPLPSDTHPSHAATDSLPSPATANTRPTPPASLSPARRSPIPSRASSPSRSSGVAPLSLSPSSSACLPEVIQRSSPRPPPTSFPAPPLASFPSSFSDDDHDSEEVDFQFSLLPSSFPRPPSGSQPSSPRPFSPSTPPPALHQHLLSLVPATPIKDSFDVDSTSSAPPPASSTERSVLPVPSPVASIKERPSSASSTYSSTSTDSSTSSTPATSASLLALPSSQGRRPSEDITPQPNPSSLPLPPSPNPPSDEFDAVTPVRTPSPLPSSSSVSSPNRNPQTLSPNPNMADYAQRRAPSSWEYAQKSAGSGGRSDGGGSDDSFGVDPRRRGSGPDSRARGVGGTFGNPSVDTFGGNGGEEYESEKRDAFNQESLGRMRSRGSNGAGGPRRRQSPSFDDEDDYEEDERATSTRFPTPPDHSNYSRTGRMDPPPLPSAPPPLPPNQPGSSAAASVRSHSTDPHSTLNSSRSRTARPSNGSSYSGSMQSSSHYAPSSARTSMYSTSTGGRDRETYEQQDPHSRRGVERSASQSFFSNGGSSNGGSSVGSPMYSPTTSPYPSQQGIPRSTSLSTLNQYPSHPPPPPPPPLGPPPNFASSSGSSRSRKESAAASNASHPFASHPFAAPPPSSMPKPHHGAHGHHHNGPISSGRQAPVAPPLQLIVSSDVDEDDTYKCPVCVERMGSDYRIQGEKPDVIPECGHAIHHDCFVHVYGPLPESNKYGVVRKPQSFGVCGVCRKPMKVGEDGGAGGGGGGKSSKLAALTGVKGMNTPAQPVLNPHQKSKNPYGDGYDSDEDDPLNELASGGASTRSGTSDHVSKYEVTHSQIVVPSVVIRPEFSSMVRTGGKDGKLTLTAVIVVDIPERVKREDIPEVIAAARGNRAPPISAGRAGVESSLNRLEPPLPITPRSPDSVAHPSPDELRRRLLFSDGDLGSASLDNLSTLLACDRALVRSSPSAASLSAKKEGKDRDYLLYLFKEALLCVQESGSTSQPSSNKLKSKTSSLFKRKPSSNALSGDGSSSPVERVLKLKGKVFVHHMKGVMDGLKSSSASASSHPAALSITIIMNDRDTDDFIVGFADRATKERWWDRITHLIPVIGRDGLPAASGGPSMGFKHSPSASHLLSPGGGGSGGSDRSTSSLASGSIRNGYSGHGANGTSSYPSALNSLTSSSAPHTPIDLLLILSLSSPSTSSSATALRTRVIRSSLAFIMSTLGPRDRLAVVTYENGPGGVIRKTPFLAVGREGKGRWRMQELLETIGGDPGREDSDDEGTGFIVPMHRDEKADVVSAVNVALDVVLQRKTRNPLTGMTLVSDTTDSVVRGQMDLVLARAEAANVPIHSVGYGKSHDPTPLWLISNHTNGTYTFVPDWYNLQDTLAGVVGGMMSIAVTKMKLHLSTQDNDFRIRKVQGAPHAIVSPDQKHVDIELREVRHGERKEMLVELELSVPYVEPGSARRDVSDDSGRRLAVDEMGRPGPGGRQHSGPHSDQLGESMYSTNTMIEEVPVVELDFSFHDPSCTKTCTRLARPILLLLTLTPPTSDPPSSAAQISDATITRRRMELLASDMITRALGLVSKRSHSAAQRLLGDTREIIQGVANGLMDSLGQSSNPYASQSASAKREKRDRETRETLQGLEAILGDVDVLMDGLEEGERATFERDQRNFGSQQAMILRSQKSWTARTETERLFFTSENAVELVERSVNAPRE